VKLSRLVIQLGALDTKESNLLDLAADGDLPKEKIREKLIAIRDERASIRRDIEQLEAELDTGRAVFLLALDLLERPQELYREASPALRKMMNQTIFTKLMLDGTTVAGDELAEPSDMLVKAGRAYGRTNVYYRKRPLTPLRGVAFTKASLPMI
jgi:site-specific DNA recombinase